MNVATVAIISVLVKVFGFYKEIVVLGSFGLSELLDTFYIAALIPGFINEVFLVSFKAVFIPNYVAEMKTTKRVGAFQSTSFIITIGLGLVFMGLAFLFTDIYLNVFFSGHTDTYYSLVKTQFHYLAPCMIIWGLNSLLGGLLHVHNEFKFSSVHPIFTSIAMLVCLFCFKDVLQEKVLAVGMLIGAITESVFLLLVCLKKKVLSLEKPDFHTANTKLMFKEFPARISSSFLTGLIPATDQYFAAQLVIGSVAALNYGYKVPAFISTIFILALGNVLLPYFSSLLIDNREFAFKRLYAIVKMSLIGLLIFVVPLLFLSHYITEILYERNEFTSADTLIVGNIQIAYLLAIPFTISSDIIVRFITSINKNRFLAYLSAFNLLLNIVLNYVLMQYYGVMGIALCTTFVHILKTFILYRFSLKIKTMAS